MENVLWSPACMSLSVYLSVCLSVATCLHYCTDSDGTWVSDGGCALVVHYWANLQSGHGLHCYGNITRMRNVSEYVLVLAVCLLPIVFLYSILIGGSHIFAVCESIKISNAIQLNPVSGSQLHTEGQAFALVS